MADKKPKILWANPYCLLDLSSGASMTVREQLRQLHKLGWEVRVLGATIFDSPNGITRLAEHWEKIKKSRSKIVKVNDGPLTHNLVKTKSTVRAEMTAAEEAVWYQAYTKFLDDFKPDVVYYYGGRTLDLLIGDEAHTRGIPVASYLANGNYKGTRWCRDVDLILTNSEATAKFYKDQDGIDAKPVGVFIDINSVKAKTRDPKHVLFVNPSLAKGAAIVARIAMILEKERPDITFEVVESRGNWNHLVYKVQDQYGEERRVLTNVNITPNTNNMAAVYSRTKILLAPSLWWEAYGRVISEATINKIPAVVTNRGGLPEAAGPTGLIIELPQELYKAPYNRLPSAGKIREFIDTIIKLEDDSVTYKNIVDTINASHPEQKLSESQAALHDYLISTTERQNLIQRR